MKITDEMLRQYAAEARDIWLNTLPGEDEIPEHHFPEEFMGSFETMKVEKKVSRGKKGNYLLRRATAIFLTVLIGFGMRMAESVQKNK